MAYHISNPQGQLSHPERSGETVLDREYRSLMIDGRDLTTHLRATFADPKYNPPRLSAVALRLMEMSRRPNVPVAEIVRTLEQDQLLVGQVLRRANSAQFGATEPTHSLHQAVVRLGLRPLRDLVFQVTMNMRVFRSPGYSDAMDRLRVHSIAVAETARALAWAIQFEADDAYLCGLLHDVGTAGILIAVGDAPRGKRPPPLDLIWPAVREVHEEAGEAMCRLWQLPVDVQRAVGRHHNFIHQGKADAFGALVCLADWAAERMGFGSLDPAIAALLPAQHNRTMSVLEARSLLGVSAAVSQRVAAEVRRVLAQRPETSQVQSQGR